MLYKRKKSKKVRKIRKTLIILISVLICSIILFEMQAIPFTAKCVKKQAKTVSTKIIAHSVSDISDEMKLNHIERLQQGRCSINQGFVFNDIIGNFERVADHCSNIAVALVELHEDAFDTHAYLSEIKTKQDENYMRYYQQYREEFQFMQ